MKKTRRIASNQIVLADGSIQTLSVVEIQQGIVTSCYSLTRELPQTEWMPGSVSVKRDEQGFLRAYYNGKMIQ